ncbi:MAG: helix-turn-helix transcriptional regulator [Bacteroidota bacterium]
MDADILNISFDNRSNPASSFDMLRLEELLKRENLNHNPQKLHRVNFFLIFLITGGKGRHVIDFTTYILERGTVLTVRKDQIHRFLEGKAKGYLLLFTEDLLVSYLEKREASKSLQLFNELLGIPKIQLGADEFKEISSLIREVEQEYFERMDEYTPEIIRSYIHILTNKLYRAKSGKGQIVRQKKYLKEFIQFQQLVEKNCFQTKKVGDYAHMLGLSSKTLNTISQSIVHKSAKIFIDEILITQIKRLLINSPLSIKEVAYEVGFEEPSNLHKYFKKYTHSTPEAFRRSHT